MSSVIQSLFLKIPQIEEDAVFALTARYSAALKQFENGKISAKPITLGIGKFVNTEGKTPLFRSVQRALEDQLKRRSGDSPTGGYQPIRGGVDFCGVVEELVFGEELANTVRRDGVLSSCQHLGGTGANFVQASFLAALGIQQISLSSPTWVNHKKIFPFMGVAISEYPYYDHQSGSLTFAKMLSTLRSVPGGSAVSLHGCCHNPTGMDLSPEQWRELAELLKERDLIAVFDIAYAGYGDGFEKDLYSVRYFVEQKIPTLVAFSFSKIASLYEERVGAFLCALPNGFSSSSKVNALLESLIRPSISNPPALVARALTQVLKDGSLRKDWQEELSHMAAEIRLGGELLAGELEKRGVPHGNITARKGMFAMLPVSGEQVDRLETEQQLYLMRDGRINIAALKANNVVDIAERIARVF